MNRFICIHGHFYQPPRQNPWLEVVEVQDTAAPYHDWNARITAECYAPNAAARILDPKGRITNIINNYEYISFNFGPTLLYWLEDNAPLVYQAVLEADRASRARLGRGNALAQVYNHIIMPLATRHDQLTQIRWGMRDFERRFGRAPEGMWLAEAAVNGATLELLAGEGIGFTILSPQQAARVRPGPDARWQEVAGGRVDPRRPYRVALPGGKAIAVFFYDGPLSRAVAFEGLLRDGAVLADRIKGGLDPARSEPQLVSLATDGESYGHHHRFGEMALAYALELLGKDPSLALTNFAAYLAEHPPVWEAEVVENSSWSCAHGVERWRSDCGCAINPASGWNQKWRAPLRRGLDQVKRRLDDLFAREGGQLLADPWAARDDYIATLLPGDAEAAWDGFLVRHQAHPLDPGERVRAAKLLESQHWGLFMFTSCGWFFDDVSGLETVQNLRFCARALQLAGQLDGAGWEDELLAVLAEAHSNLPAEGSGADLWHRQVDPSKVGPKRVAAHAAIRGVMGDDPLPGSLYCYRITTLRHQHRHELDLDLSWGEARVSHHRIRESHDLAFAALHGGGHDFEAFVSPREQAADLSDLSSRVEGPLRLRERQALARLLADTLRGRSYDLADLFLEGRRELADDILEKTLADHLEAVRRLYESDLDTMLFLRQIHVPLPRVFLALAEAIITEDLMVGIREPGEGPLPRRLEELAVEAKALGINLASRALTLALEDALGRDLRELAADPQDRGRARHACDLLELCEALKVAINLWEPQNHFWRILGEKTRYGLGKELFELGQRLNFELLE